MKGDSCEHGCPTGSRMATQISDQKKDILFILKQLHMLEHMQDRDRVVEVCNKYKYEPY